MWKQITTACLLLFILTLLTGVVYPLAITGAAQIFFPRQANGSIVYRDGQLVGSARIGQDFSGADYFQGRPSAAGSDGYDAVQSSGSNFGPTSAKLADAIKERITVVREESEMPLDTAVPADLVTASASGLDPDISPAAAYVQVRRVARVRGITEDEVRRLVDSHIQGRQWGVLGEPRVNVLALNLALDALTQP